MPELGYWQGSIKEIRIGGVAMDICKSGTCRGIVDTGTSHLGIPGAQLPDFMGQLSIDTSNAPADCRALQGHDFEFVLEGNITLSLNPEHYMRPLPLSLAAPVQSQALDVLRGPQQKTCAPRLMPVNL